MTVDAQPPRYSILLYGDSGDGKTTSIGVYAEWLMDTFKLRTRIYNADGGGWSSIQGLIDAGVIELIQCHHRKNPWVWVDAASKGKVLASDGETWVLDEARNALFGCFAFDGLTGFGDALMAGMRDPKEAPVGGGSGMVVLQGDYRFGTNTQAHYGLAQGALMDALGNSQGLPGVLIWTAMASRSKDEVSAGAVIGPKGPGKAMTDDLPRNLTYTFRIVQHVDLNRNVHRLYWDDFTDPTAPGAKCLGNSRLPLGADVPQNYVEPANIAEAIKIFDEARAKDKQRKQDRWGKVVASLPPLPPLPAPPQRAAVLPIQGGRNVIVGKK